MSRVRTRLTGSARKRDVSADLRTRRGRMTRAEFIPSEPLLEYNQPCGDHPKWCNLYFGGESRAGD